MRRTRIIEVPALARVEGEGALQLRIAGGKVVKAELQIYEPPRFFEAFLRGRHFTEASDITARICGICPIAYQMSAVHAMENACGVQVDGTIRALRRLAYCGEWIESHALHVYAMHAPDFLGYDSIMHMARDMPDVVRRGLQLKKVGNELIEILGGRAIHPINIRIGGFYKAPTKRDLIRIKERLDWAREAALDTVRWVATFRFPRFEEDYEFVGLRHPDEYPFNEGRLVSNKGLDIAVNEYEEHFVEEQAPHSNALQSRLKEGGPYLVGPLARYNLNFNKLSPLAQRTAREAGLEPTCRNNFKSIIVRAVEILYACEEALRIIDEYEPPPQPFIKVQPLAATGYGCTEAPRGILYHRYMVGRNGLILNAKIVPPTSQNQSIMENDLKDLVQRNLDLPRDKLTRRCEQLIRNYDPCISCATHFLKINIEHE